MQQNRQYSSKGSKLTSCKPRIKIRSLSSENLYKIGESIKVNPSSCQNMGSDSLAEFDSIDVEFPKLTPPSDRIGMDFETLIKKHIFNRKQHFCNDWEIISKDKCMMSSSEQMESSELPNDDLYLVDDSDLSLDESSWSMISAEDLEVDMLGYDLIRETPTPSEGKEDKVKKKKKIKWEPISHLQLNYHSKLYLDQSLLPRNEGMGQDWEDHNDMTYDPEFEPWFETLDMFYPEILEMEGNTQNDILMRHKKKFKKRKIQNQVKNKYFTRVKYNDGRSVTIRARDYKRIRTGRDMTLNLMPVKMPKSLNKQELEDLKARTKNEKLRSYDELQKRASDKQSRSKRCKCAICVDTGRHHSMYNDRDYPIAEAYTLHHKNLPNPVRENVDNSTVDLLIQLQNRDLSPEDYDLLLTLDALFVQPKTVSEDVIDRLPKTEVTNNEAMEVCSVCMELYITGQIQTKLNCEHYFHENCIKMWLNNSSMNCPLDGLPVV